MLNNNLDNFIRFPKFEGELKVEFEEFLSQVEPNFKEIMSQIETETKNISGSVTENIENLLNGTNLFGTIIVDSYTKQENDISSIFTALSCVCHRLGKWSFDMYGVYFFWDFDTKEILYIGVTTNLTQRFGEHNGVLDVEGLKSTKYHEIQDYFKTKDRLGYSVFVQDPFRHDPSTHYPDKKEEAFTIESAFLEEYRQKFSNYPIWNKIGGIKKGRSPEMMKRYGNIFDMVTLSRIGFLNAKSTLREIEKDEVKKAHEYHLNAVRSHMYKYGWTFSQSLSNLVKFTKLMHKHFPPEDLNITPDYKFFELLGDSDYLQKVVKLQC